MEQQSDDDAPAKKRRRVDTVVAEASGANGKVQMTTNLGSSRQRQACCVWADISANPAGFLETAFATPKGAPTPSLGQVIIYFPVYLAFTEFYGLIEYPHLFRFVHHAYHTDLGSSTDFRINDRALDEATARVQLFRPGDKLTILPSDLELSLMQNITSLRKRTRQEMAVLGVGDVYQHHIMDFRQF